MSDFEKWAKYNLGYTGKEAFEAGQASKKAEIEKLKAEKEGLEKRNHDLEFYVRQFLNVLASEHEPHREALPELLCHLNHLVNSEKTLRGDSDQHLTR